MRWHSSCLTKCLFICYREAGRIVLIPFQPPDESQPSTDDSELLQAQKTCGDAVCFVVGLGEVFLSAEGRAEHSSLQQWVEKEVNGRAEQAGVANQINTRLHKTYSLLLYFTTKASWLHTVFVTDQFRCSVYPLHKTNIDLSMCIAQLLQQLSCTY